MHVYLFWKITLKKIWNLMRGLCKKYLYDKPAWNVIMKLPPSAVFLTMHTYLSVCQLAVKRRKKIKLWGYTDTYLFMEVLLSTYKTSQNKIVLKLLLTLYNPHKSQPGWFCLAESKSKRWIMVFAYHHDTETWESDLPHCTYIVLARVPHDFTFY